jgi:hypothetical protein
LSRLVVIRTFTTRSDAEIAQGFLAAAGIASSLTSDDAGGAYPFDLSGGAQLLVDEDDVQAASELLPRS